MKNHALIGIGLSCAALALPAKGQVPVSQPAEQVQSVRDRAFGLLINGQGEVDRWQQTYESYVVRAEALRKDLRESTQRLDVSPETLQKAANRLDEQLEGLELEEVAAKARRHATETAIREESDRAQARMQNDPVTNELQKVVAVRESQFKETQSGYNSGVMPRSELRTAEAALAEAKVKIAERQHAVFTGGDSETIASFRRDLVSLTIGEEERNARLKYLNDRRKSLAVAITQIPELQRVQDAIQTAQRELARATRDLDAIATPSLKQQFREFSEPITTTKDEKPTAKKQ